MTFPEDQKDCIARGINRCDFGKRIPQSRLAQVWSDLDDLLVGRTAYIPFKGNR